MNSSSLLIILITSVVLIVFGFLAFRKFKNMKGGSFSYLNEDISEGNIASYSGLPNIGRVYLPMPLYASIANLPQMTTVYGHPLPLVVPSPGPLSQPMYIEHNAGYTCQKSCCPSDQSCVGGCVCKPYIWTTN